MSKSKNNFSEESLESTRKKKMEEFEMNYDSNAMNGQRNYDQALERSRSNDSNRRRRRSREINSFSDDDTKARIEKESRKALQRQRKEDKKIEKRKAKHNKTMFKWIWFIMIIFVAIILSQILLVGINDMLAISRQKNVTTVSVTIPEKPEIIAKNDTNMQRLKETDEQGETVEPLEKINQGELEKANEKYLQDIADALQNAGAINRSDVFFLYEKMTTDASLFHKGTFDLETNKDYEAIINFLQSDTNRKVIQVQITEGMNTLEIAKLLFEQDVIANVDEFLNKANSDDFDSQYTFLKDISNKDARFCKLEGYLFPDTYEFFADEDYSSVIRKMLDNFKDKVIDSSINDSIKDSGYSLDQIINIASLIQAEAADTDDMYNISSIIHNRLDYGAEAGVPFLGIDSTMNYPYRNKSDVPEDDTYLAKIDFDTYENTGLPPGPICNPSLDAIKAAVDPNTTDYLYFCHSSPEDGSKAYYASNFDDHNYNLYLAGLR